MDAAPPPQTRAPDPPATGLGCRVAAGCLLLSIFAIPALGLAGASFAAYQRAQNRRAFNSGARSFGGGAGTQPGYDPAPARNDPPDVARCRSALGRLKIALQEYQNDEVFFPRNPVPRDEATIFRNDVAFAVVGLTAPRQEGGGRGTPYLEWAKLGRDADERPVFLDPWGHPIVYREWASLADGLRLKARATRLVNGQQVADVPHDDQQFDVYSFGPNGVNEYGGGDDVRSW